jgi:hypothetical protein
MRTTFQRELPLGLVWTFAAVMAGSCFDSQEGIDIQGDRGFSTRIGHGF